jgi:hypothetical protein
MAIFNITNKEGIPQCPDIEFKTDNNIIKIDNFNYKISELIIKYCNDNLLNFKTDNQNIHVDTTTLKISQLQITSDQWNGLI